MQEKVSEELRKRLIEFLDFGSWERELCEVVIPDDSAMVPATSTCSVCVFNDCSSARRRWAVSFGTLFPGRRDDIRRCSVSGSY